MHNEVGKKTEEITSSSGENAAFSNQGTVTWKFYNHKMLYNMSKVPKCYINYQEISFGLLGGGGSFYNHFHFAI